MPDFKKYYIIPATPDELYTALISPATIQLWTGEKAEMSEEPGSEFSLWEDSIVGRNLEFERPHKIVQQWYFDQDEPSIVTLKLHPHKQGTSLEVRHTQIPAGEYDEVVKGWDDVYVASLLAFYS